MSTKRQAAGSQLDGAGRELRHFAERLRAGEDSQGIADELDRLAAKLGGLPRGRPKAPPADRVRRRLWRALISDAIYRGVFPKELYPAHLQEAPREGSRIDADQVVAEILGVKPRVIQAARKACLYKGEIYPLGIDRRGKQLDFEGFEELKALFRLAPPDPQVNRAD